MEKQELNPTEELLKHHNLDKLISKIESDHSAVCIGKIADEDGLVGETDPDKKVKDDYPPYSPLRQALRKAHKSVSFAFDLGRSGLSGFSLQIRSADGLIDCGPVGCINTKVLKQHCVPAPFGDLITMTTKVDPEVRSALTIDADKVIIKPRWHTYEDNGKLPQEDDYKTELRNLLERVQEELQDDTLYLEPYRLNMYEKKGFFKPHKDSPRFSNMVATLVLVLQESEGGDLIIRHGNESFTSQSEATVFFCDREHEVTPVKHGTRVTLTFNICKDSETVVKTERAITCTRSTPLIKDHNVASLIKAIKESPFKKIGILTEFDYTQNGITLQTLKGTDRVLLEELSKETSFKVDLLPSVVSKHYRDDSDTQYSYPPTYYIDGKVYRFLAEDLERMSRREKAEKIPEEDLALFFFIKDGLEVYRREEDGIDWVSNEAQLRAIDNIYFNAAIVVTDMNTKPLKTVNIDFL